MKNYLIEEPDRFLEYPFSENSKISNFEEFTSAFRKAFSTGTGNNLKFSNDDLIELFETRECKERIRENVESNEEFEKIYGDGNKVEYQTRGKSETVKITIPKIKIWRMGKYYERAKPQRFTPAQNKFIAVRKEKGRTPRQITEQFNKSYPNNMRTEKSIQSKFYRIKK